MKTTTNRLKIGNWYEIKDNNDGTKHIAQYIGRQGGFECCVCGKGCIAKTFNIWYDANGGYETWGFGPNHMPTIINDLGESKKPIIDN